MRKTFFLLFIMILAILPSAYPHSPSDIAITVSAQSVNIKVSHSVSDPAAHYIKKIVIKVNNEDIFTDEFTSQPGDYQLLERAIPGLKKGDVLVITAYCSRYGELTKEFKVG